MRNRWNLLLGLAQNWWKTGVPDARKAMKNWGGEIGKSTETVAEWLRLFSVQNADGTLADTATIAAGLLPYAPLDEGDAQHLAVVSALAAMSPEFQIC
jgi:hypothetical protein